MEYPEIHTYVHVYNVCVCVHVRAHAHVCVCVCVKGIEHTLMTALNLYLNEFEPHA